MTWRALSPPAPVMTADPVGQPSYRSYSSRISPGPAARCIAPSTPPPPASAAFAALTSASTVRVVMSAPQSRIRPLPASRTSRSGPIRARQGEAHVVPAKPVRRAQREVDASAAATVGHVVEVALRVGLVQVDRRRYELVTNGQNRDDRLDRAGRAEQVPVHRLRRRHRDGAGLRPESGFHRTGFGGVVHLRRRAVGVDVVDLVWLTAGALERSQDAASRAVTLLVG